MKKIYSLLMAFCMVLGATAGNVAGLNPVKVAKVEKVTKQVNHEASRQAIAKKMQNAPTANLNAVREYKALNALSVEKQKLNNDAKKAAAKQTAQATTADTIVIVADQWVYKYYAETGDWYMAIADESMTYIVNLDYYSDSFTGTYTEADLDLWYSYIQYLDADGYTNYIDIVEADFTVTDDENGKSVDVTILGSDGNVYVTYAYEAPLPEAKGEKTLAYTTAELLDFTASSGMWQFWAEENGWYTSIVMAAYQVEGEYTRVDMVDPYYNYLAYFTATDTTIIDMLDINATVTKEGKTYNLVADVLGSDTIMYHITMSYTRPDPTDTVSIVATDLYIDEFEFWGMVFVTAEASNDEYSVLLSANDFLTAGQYNGGDLSLGSCEITDKVNKTTTTLLEANLTVAGEGTARTIVGSVLGLDNVLYNLDLSYVIPEVADTVKIVFETPGVAEWYDADGDYFIYNENDEYFVYLDMLTDRDNFAGEFTAEDFILTYTAVGEIVDGDTTLIMAADAKAVVTTAGENLVHIEAELTGKNGTLYLVSTDVELPGKGMQYDMTEGSVNVVYTDNDNVEIVTEYISEGLIYLDITAADGSNTISVVFFAEETDPVITIPAGTYPIDDSQDYGTVMSSPGVQSGYIYPSFYGNLNAQGQISAPCYFMVDGNVVVENNNGRLKVTINALNSYNVPATIVYEASGSSAVENINVNVEGIRKQIIDGQLVIIRDGKAYNAQGAQVK